MTLPQVRDWYKLRRGTQNGIPVEHISVNIVAYDLLQKAADAFIDDFGLDIVANDYNSNSARGPVQTNACHDSFQVEFLKPVFTIITCVSNSPSHQQNTVLLNQGGGPANWDVAAAQWRTAIESVQAPLPEITTVRPTPIGGIRFTIPGQRGRTNQVLSSSDLINWNVLSNFYGNNGPIVVRIDNIAGTNRRFYRVRRL